MLEGTPGGGRIFCILESLDGLARRVKPEPQAERRGRMRTGERGTAFGGIKEYDRREHLARRAISGEPGKWEPEARHERRGAFFRLAAFVGAGWSLTKNKNGFVCFL